MHVEVKFSDRAGPGSHNGYTRRFPTNGVYTLELQMESANLSSTTDESRVQLMSLEWVRLAVTWLPSSSEHVTRKNKKHKQRRNQGGQKGLSESLAGTGVCVQTPFRLILTASLARLENELPCPLPPKTAQGGDRVFCHSAHTHTHTRARADSRPSPRSSGCNDWGAPAEAQHAPSQAERRLTRKTVNARVPARSLG